MGCVWGERGLGTRFLCIFNEFLSEIPIYS